VAGASPTTGCRSDHAAGEHAGQSLRLRRHLDPSVERGEYPTEVLDDFAFNGPPERSEMLHAPEVGVDEIAPCYLNGRLEEMEIVGRRSFGRGSITRLGASESPITGRRRNVSYVGQSMPMMTNARSPRARARSSTMSGFRG
jgi:hypothetical protein